MKQILIINGHPDKQSLCHQLAESNKTGAEKAGFSRWKNWVKD
jgi:putative NADPH-quinone reductase